MFIRSFIVLLTILFITIGFASCSIFIEKVKFTKEELIHYNVYNKKDMLIFMNLQTHDKDTSIIIKKRVYYDWQLLAYSQYITSFADVIYSNKNLNRSDIKNQEYMISIHKSEPRSFIRQEINYLYLNFLIDEGELLSAEYLTINKKRIFKVYKLTYNKKGPFLYRINDDSPEILYWNTDYGIIKYVSFNGNVWERINF